MHQLQTIGFDYSTLPADVATDARAAAERIRRNYHKHVEDGMAIGKDLIAIKERLGHGSFSPWVEAEFGWTIRMAQNYMQLCERFGSNANPVSHLPLTTAFRLAAPSTPEPVVREVISRAEAGSPLPRREVEHLIFEAKEAAAKAEAEAKITPEEHKKRLQAKQAAKRREELREQKWKAEQDADRAQAKEVAERVAAFLKGKLQPDDLDAFMKLTKRVNWYHVECAVTGSRMPWEL